jgi:tetratricopeptide (TPR) repeat protein
VSSLFVHQKLDWSIKRLEQRLDEVPDDVVARLEYASACLSKARFHDGGEAWFNRAITEARRVLMNDASNAAALVIAGMSLVGLERLDPAQRYLDEALRAAPERGDVHLGLAMLHEQRGEPREAVREAELACRYEPNAWEPHAYLGRLLADRAQVLSDERRVLERSQFHVVRALQIGSSVAPMPELLHELGVGLLKMGRIPEAQKVFTRLQGHDRWRPSARYHLGLASYQLGKYKNAILFLRQYLDERPDVARVWSRIGMSYLHLGEVARAREACHKALALDGHDLQARWTLGCALLEEGNVDDAVRTLKDILRDAPDHAPAFHELVRLRSGDGAWLLAALRSEVSGHDRLPVAGTRPGPGGRPVPTAPRRAVRDRIGILLHGLAELEDDHTQAILQCMDLTTDEGLRFQLWDAALDRMARTRAREVVGRLREPGVGYGAAPGRDALVLASVLPEPLLTQGIQVTEEDLKRAAVERHGATRDVVAHRANIERERQDARAWQALLLLAIAARESAGARSLLVRWASDADPELADAARAALVMLGDASAAAALRTRAAQRNAEHLVDTLVERVAPGEARFQPRPVSDDEVVCCSTCGRRAPEVDHMLAGGDAVVCTHCIAAIAKQRRELAVDDPRTRCALCGRTNLLARAVYVLHAVPVCSECIDHSLGMLEREEIDRYLTGW